jgi:hypothetical protein
MEEDEDDNPFDIYKLDSPGFVIPKKRAADTPRKLTRIRAWGYSMA